MAEDRSADEAPITFNVKSSSDAKYVLTLPLTTTVIDLKQKLSTAEYADLTPDRQRLIYSGRVLKDPDTLGSYKIRDGHTVHLVKGAASNQRQNPANQGSSANTGPSSSSPTATGVPSNIAAGTGNNPLAGLTGARYAGFSQLPNQSMFGPDGGMGPPPDPEQMIGMLQNPQFASTLNEALQNPQLIDMMLQQNPMLRNMGPEVRQMMQSPEFRRMMTDPEALRQMTQMQRQLGPLFGGGMGGGAGGSGAFPAPGVTDTTPGTQPQADGTTSASPNQTNTTGSVPPPFNPLAMFGNPGGAQAANNPFAALFNPTAFAPPSTTSPPPAQGQGPSTGTEGTDGATRNETATTSPQQPQQQQQPPNPFANLTSNPLFQNPALMQQMLSTMGGQQPPSSNQASNPTAPGSNPFANLFGQGGMLGGGPFGGAGFPGGAAGMGGGGPPDTRPPEERYADQLRQLNDMGFYEFERNVEALRRTGGSVQGAVEYLLTH